MKAIIFSIITLVITGLIIVPGCTNKTNNSNERTLTVGIASGYAPFVSLNERGNYEGFDIDVINDVAQKTNRSLKLVDLGSMSSLFMALNQGSIDAIIWGLSITQDRCAKVAMINYFGEATTSYPLLFWNNIPQNIRSAENMQEMTVCVEPGSAQENALKGYSFKNIMTCEKIDDALLNIQFGKADAALVEPAIAKKFMRRYSEIKTLELPLSPDLQEQGIGIALKKDNIFLIQELTQAVESLKQEGRITNFAGKWGIE